MALSIQYFDDISSNWSRDVLTQGQGGSPCPPGATDAPASPLVPAVPCCWTRCEHSSSPQCNAETCCGKAGAAPTSLPPPEMLFFDSLWCRGAFVSSSVRGWARTERRRSSLPCCPSHVRFYNGSTEVRVREWMLLSVSAAWPKPDLVSAGTQVLWPEASAQAHLEAFRTLWPHCTRILAVQTGIHGARDGSPGMSPVPEGDAEPHVLRKPLKAKGGPHAAAELPLSLVGTGLSMGTGLSPAQDLGSENLASGVH